MITLINVLLLQAVTQTVLYVPVTVTAARNSYMTGLTQEHFRIAEANADQKITYFMPNNTPSSFALIIGAGGLSVRSDRFSTTIRTAAETFQQRSHPDSQYFVDVFGQDGVGGAVARALKGLAASKNPKKAVIVVMDGSDNPGGNYERPSMDFALKQDIPIYFIFVSGTRAGVALDLPSIGGTTGLSGTFPGAWLTVMEEVSKSTGGRVIYPEPYVELQLEMEKLATELRQQYVIGYTSSKPARDGKWRNLKVTVNPPAGQPKANVRTRPRYFVPKD